MVLKRSLVLVAFMLLATPHLVLASKTHIVRKSESLNSIAHKYHVSADELKTVNNLSSSHLDKGMKVIIPSHVAADVVKKKIAEKQKNYTVAKGDTLPKIAKKTGVKMADIRKLNRLKGNRIATGQVLALAAPSVMDDKFESSKGFASPSLQLVNRDLLNEQELVNTLAELTDVAQEKPVDLAKTLKENSAGVNKLKKTAYSFLGARYVFGGNSKNALDCSSFVQQVFRKENVNLPRTAREQFSVGNEVVRGDLRKGDLVFFQTYANFPSHVGIYLGNRKMIHASSRDRRVVISSMDTSYYTSRYLGARRIGKVSADALNFDELLLGIEEEQDTDAINNDMLGVSLNIPN